MCTLVLLLFCALNLIAFVHAYSMSHFTDSGLRTRRPHELSAVEKTRALLTGMRLSKPRNNETPATLGLRFSTHRFVGTDGTEYEAWHIPARRLPWQRSRGICLMFHGYADCKGGLLREAEVIRRAGYDAFLVDFRASGGTSGHVTTAGYREADDVAESWGYVSRTFRPRRRVIYGRSMGAAAVLHAIALGKVQPDALVLESPFDRLSTTIGRRFEAMGVPSFPVASLTVFWGGVQQGYWGFGHNPVNYARSVHCPTLMIRAGSDQFIQEHEAKSVLDSVSGQKQLLVFEGAGHQPCIRSDYHLWARSVKAFLVK